MTAQDGSGGSFTSNSETLTVNPAPTFGLLSPASAPAGQAYTGSILVSGGTGPFSIVTTTLPSGYNASVSGATLTITSASPTAGTVNFTVTVQDASGASFTSSTESLTVKPAPIFSTLAPASWTAGSAYTGTITISGGTGPYSNLSTSGLPAGYSASLSGNTITVTNPNPSVGTVNFSVTITDGSGFSFTGSNEALTINPSPTFSALAPAMAPAGAAYSGTITIGGGTGPFSILTTTLPAGYNAGVGGNTIAISSANPSAGTVNFTVTVQDAAGGSYTTPAEILTVNPAPSFSALAPSAWTTGAAYSGTITISGGTGTYSNLSTSGLPAGYSASLSGNTITVTSASPSVGTVNFTVTITDGSGSRFTSGTESLTVNPTATFGALTPAAAPSGQFYGGTTAILGGTGPFTNLTTTLPSGYAATVSGSTITITNGSPTAGTVTFTVSLTDASGSTFSSGTETLTIKPAPNFSALSPALWTGGVAYTGTLTLSGGPGPYSNLSTTLPPGYTASLSGSIITVTSSNPTVGTVNFTVTVTDPNGTFTSAVKTLTVGTATVWTGAAGDSQWSTPGNWNDGIVPGAGADAYIGPGFTVYNSAANSSVRSLELDGSTLIDSGTITVTGPFTDITGTLSGGGKLIAASSLQVNGGTLSSFTLNNLATGILNSLALTNGSNLVNAGHLTWTGGTVSFAGNSGFSNTTPGTFVDPVDGTFGSTDGSQFPTFTNTGTFVKTGGTGTTYLLMQLVNGGAVNVVQGDLVLGFGYVQASGGTGTVSGNVSNPNFFSGAIAVGGVTNPGAISLGPSSSPPPVLSSFTQLASGSLNVQIGGPTPGSQYGQIVVAGGVNLAGALNVSLVNGFTPQAGQQFIIIANEGGKAVNGIFTGLPEGATLTVGSTRFSVSYAGGTGHDVVLTTLAPLLPVTSPSLAAPPPTAAVTAATSSEVAASSLLVSLNIAPLTPPTPTTSPQLTYFLNSGGTGSGGAIPAPAPLVVTGTAFAGSNTALTVFTALVPGAPSEVSAIDFNSVLGPNQLPAGILSGNELFLPTEKEILAADTLAEAMFTGQVSVADLLPHKGSQVAPVGTLLSDSPGLMRKKVRNPGDSGNVPLGGYLENRVVPYFHIEPPQTPTEAAGQTPGPISLRSISDDTEQASSASSSMLLEAAFATVGSEERNLEEWQSLLLITSLAVNLPHLGAPNPRQVGRRVAQSAASLDEAVNTDPREKDQV